MSELTMEGERFMPEHMDGAIALEHWHRYLFAQQFVAGRRVLDIACGEGYGSSLLARHAARVTGVDIDTRAVEHARAKYHADTLEFRVGSCAAIPLDDASVDVVVSFETLEHHEDHDAMMREVKRVLRPGGRLVISSPDRVEYSERTGQTNPFHVRELDAGEFEALLRAYFAHARIARQRVVAGSWLLDEHGSDGLEFFDASGGLEPERRLPRAPFLLAVAGDDAIAPLRGGLYEADPSRLNADVIRAARNDTAHALRALALPGSGVLSEWLGSAWYVQHNPDLAALSVPERLEHWLRTGIDEGRLPAPDAPAMAQALLAEQLAAHGVSAVSLSEQLRSVVRDELDALRPLLDDQRAAAERQVDAWAEARSSYAEALERQRASALAAAGSAAAELNAAKSDAAEQRAQAEAVINELRTKLAAATAQVARLETALSEGSDRGAAESAARQLELAQCRHEAALREAHYRTELEASGSREADSIRRHDEQAAALGGRIDELLARERDQTQRMQAERAELQRQLEATREQARQSLAEREAHWSSLLDAARDEGRQALAQAATLAAASAEERAQLRSTHQEAVDRLQSRLAAIEASASWRWTAPFRRPHAAEVAPVSPTDNETPPR